MCGEKQTGLYPGAQRPLPGRGWQKRSPHSHVCHCGRMYERKAHFFLCSSLGNESIIIYFYSFFKLVYFCQWVLLWYFLFNGFFFILIYSVGGVMWWAYVSTAPVCRSEGNLQGSILSYHHVGPRIKPRLSGLCPKQPSCRFTHVC